jgi:tetratricopeptide (TPR) repeat protein
MITTNLTTIASYPTLLQHEQNLSLQANTTSGSIGAYDVMAWMEYLECVDDVLDTLNEGYSRMIIAPPGGATSTAAADARTTTIEAADRTFHVSLHLAPGITHTPSQFLKEMKHLIRARIMIGERSVSLLPGSYKLWMKHLSFCLSLLDHSSSSLYTHRNQPKMGEEMEHEMEYNKQRLPVYLLSSSSSHNHYKLTQSAFERALVRLHKMPKLWLMYAAFVSLYDPLRDPTTVRRVYDRALVALPASQHERVWEEIICWVTGILPSVKGDAVDESGGSGGLMIKRRGIHKVKYGFESPLVAEWRKRGWGWNQTAPVVEEGQHDGMGYLPTVPTETALRILRRHALCFDTTFREDLATLCITRYKRYGEGASLLLQLLNNENASGSSTTFLSPNGTTRHELWLRFADVCTSHPKEAKVAGVDFDGIMRAVLKGQDPFSSGGDASGIGSGMGGDGLGFDVFDNSSEAFGADDDEKQQQKQQKNIQVISHRLGEMEGTLWTRLAEYHVRAGDFELARSVYEEALDAITRVRDFSLVFDAYVRFEEGVIEALMELMEEEDEEGDGMEEEDNQGKANEEAVNDDEDLDILLGDNSLQDENAESSADVELAISRAEHLTSRRPLLLNRVLLRQNPNNVGEWIKRSQLYLDLGEVDMAASALEEALKSVNSGKAVNGSPSTIVLTLIDVHENKQKDLEAARNVLERICYNNEYTFTDTDDLAQCHSAWVELELRQENWDMALNLARRAVSSNTGGQKRGFKAVRGLSRSLRLWNLLFDLEESLGTVQTTKDAYDRSLELKVATPSHVLNYANFLKDKKYFEESFAAYERGLGLFPFPHAGATLLWKNYLTNFLERYEGSKTPRVRELFDRCLADCPPEESPEFYLQYGEYEETHGLTKRALGVYERMCNAVPAAEKYTAFRLYIAKAIKYLGVTSARPIYERAISALEDKPAASICLEYAKMETGLRETDRARTVLVFGAQLADPRRDPDYWNAWHEFEVSHGNEETFREMLRVKRSVQAAFSTVNYNAAEMGSGAPKVDTLTEESALEMIAEREGIETEKQPVVGGFVQAKRTADMADLGEVERRAARLRQATGAQNVSAGDDEIDIDDVDEEGEEPQQAPRTSNVGGVSTKAVPAAVFGGITTCGDN